MEQTRSDLKLLFEKGDKPTQEHFENLIDSSWNKKEDPLQLSFSTSTNIDNAFKLDNVKLYGKNIILNNGSSNIDFTCLASSEADFFCMITKAGTGSITIKTTGGTTINKIDYTDVLNGGIGSTAKIQRIGNVFYIRIFNA